MDEMLSNFPFWGAWIFMYVLGTLRGQGTYWIGRGASSAATHVGSEEEHDSKWAQIKAWLNSDRTKTGRTLVHKIGVVAVPLSYLTVGLQTAVLAAAGLVRIQWWKFTVAQIPGAIAWATIYSGVGLAGWSAVLAIFTGDGIVPAIVFVVLVAVVIAAIVFVSKSLRKNSAAKTQRDVPAGSTSTSAAELDVNTDNSVPTRH
ncbi:VTT domain-containing protein [Corynebacterium stationis]|uniref:DedA family protein n=1 Tax=Corynebacterium stationis TaxID=1705 RepID=UPI00273CE0B7|nr:VTT domain-containing protein [Corynebacterium stationis]WLP86047.1 VTT domain-containing protein [Corynebacterium stationis]